MPASAASALVPAPAVSAATASAVADEPTAGPGAVGPDLSSANRTTPAAGMPDWSRAGYLGGQPLPGDGDLTTDSSCLITPEELASQYGVVPGDGVDDTTGLQNAIDDIKSHCSPGANFHRLSLITLPSGRIDVSRQMYVDASFLIVRGQGSGDGGTQLVFRPDLNTRYDTVLNGRWDQDSMVAGTGNDEGSGGWMWPGRGMFRVQTRDVADRYQDDWAAAPANRKDIFEGSVNQHWVSGMKLSAQADDPGYSARKGQNVVHLDPTANMGKFTLGGYVWVGAANSRNFYALQDVTDLSEMDNLHMRQQMFRVTSVDGTAKTITLDRPLEWDLPVDSTSDGSAPILGKVSPSKVTPLKVVEGVGFEDFAFTQDMNGVPKLGGGTYSLTPDQAVNNYGNMAPEYAMHGIVFKWAANSWARGLKATMTGSHPIVTEVARNLQIERNSFDGAWNKGKGGNGYLRGSRVWDSLYAYNLSRNLRHFTFQWSASGNVAFRNDLDSDLNLHGGWEHNNLLEQNTLNVSYDHRSASCTANCGGEGGEIDAGTWYPIWWAAGPKAAKWSGSSGPQNVFYNNTMVKQTTPGGPYVPYTPYGTQAGTAFEFGSDNDDPTQFHPLSQGGQPIPDWTGRETLDYTGQGVVARDMGGQPSLFLRDTGGLDPRQGGRRKVVTWNMQGAGTTNGWGDDTVREYESKYSLGLPQLVMQSQADIALLQEAGAPPPSAVLLQDIPQESFFQWDGSAPPVREYRYAGTASRPQGFLYWLHTDTDQTSATGRVNLAIATRTPVQPQNVYVVPAGLDSGFTGRPALGVNVDGVVYFTVHGLSGSGNDDPGLLRNIRERMLTAGPGGTALPWIALGDYNRAPYSPEPGALSTALSQDYDGLFRVEADRNEATHPTRPDSGTPRVLDYAVMPAPALTEITVTGMARVNTMTLSDHFPVLYQFGNLPDPPSPPAQAVPNPPVTAVLRNSGTTHVAGPSAIDTHVIADMPLNQANLPTQTFSLSPEAEFPGYYRLIQQSTARYLGQEDSVRNARVVLWQTEAEDQLWRPSYQGDGTWTLQNFVTNQLLTALDSGGIVAGRDFDGSAAQRWFLQDPARAATVDEITLNNQSPTPLAVNVAGASTAEDTPVILYQDNDDPNERFTAIYADQTGGDDCYYLAYGGKYINSTSADPRNPHDGNQVTLNAFSPNDDGYLWCVKPNGSNGMFLSNHLTAALDQRLYLTAHGENNQLTIGERVPGLPTDLWGLVPVS
ncbi:endonuclease/exonuclease/phosphatase family protein [Kribbella kalugense]|uniref:endonuclease/exonuclease/phosphatase family protein n=1 Tax=Kribbella kalugense TaxID=2512221 RepID=UPI001067170E|nr:RICIN domain-containing protein [Kribbella kalugense]